ncbi:MAG: sulfotransferase [Gemmatimonadetes bacterium]|nr:sulfotransferase [Gemmatimonadota bacterium]
MPHPLFILGKHRSGTTWLANQLAEHSRIAGVRHVRHHGIHESVFFSQVYSRYGDLAVRSNFVEFVEVMAASDYFRLAGVTRDDLHSLWPATYEAVFRTVMDRYAARRGADYWLEKSPAHTPLVARLAALYPDARFVGIIRDAQAVVASTLGLFEMRYPERASRRTARAREILETVIGWAYYNQAMRRFAAKSSRILVVDYASLEADLPGTLQAVCAFLRIPYEESMCRRSYAPNTSFRDRSRRPRSLKVGEPQLVRAATTLLAAVPFRTLGVLRGVRRRQHRRAPLPDWFFSLLDRQPEPGVLGARPDARTPLEVAE